MQAKQKRLNSRTTIKDVASYAGVTIGTVSHVINGTASITEETSAKVRKAIKDLNYIPNASAKSLRSKKNLRIGMMIPNLNNNFHSKITSTFVDRAYDEGYSVQIYGYEYSLKREMQELRRLEGENIGTLIIINGTGDEEELERLTQQGIAVILADREAPGLKVSSVKYDNYEIMDEIVTLFKKKGYQRIGFFSEPIELANLQDRFEGYKNALEKNGYEFNDKYTYIKESLQLDNLKNGYLYMKEILSTTRKENLPDAWIVSSDLLGIGMLRAIKEMGYKVPQDFGIVSFDNIEVSGYINPRLTTVEQDQVLMGETLMKVVKQVNNNRDNLKNIVLKQRLIIRETV